MEGKITERTGRKCRKGMKPRMDNAITPKIPASTQVLATIADGMDKRELWQALVGQGYGMDIAYVSETVEKLEKAGLVRFVFDQPNLRAILKLA